ncbi:MAG: DUF309 domain-containing protein, partial [Verrucomicrobiota bacterium]
GGSAVELSSVSKKSAKIAALIEDCRGKGWDPHYLGFFECFNRQLFFEAHDVLEELWLAGGRTAPNYGFHKGLIQLAGAFVHLQKDRLRPAVSLFNLAEQHLGAYPARHDGCDLGAILRLIADWRGRVETGGWQVNPLPVSEPPRLARPDPP